MACLRMLIVSFVVILAFLCPLRVLTDDTEYGLLQPYRKKYIPVVAAFGYSVDLNCQLTDPDVDVLLIQEIKVMESVTGPTKAIDLKRTPDGVKVTQSGQIFTINNVEQSDKGIYYCKAQSTSLKIEKLIPVPFGPTQVSYISSHSILPRSNSVFEGESITFSCNVTGKGIKNVEWFKDKMRLPSTFYRSGNSYISYLQLTAVTVSQAGAFECRTTVVPTWYKGYQGKTGMLFVKEFHFLAKKKPYQGVFVGDPVIFNCQTNSQKASSNLWVRKGTSPATQIVPNGGSITRRNNTYIFHSVTLDDAGIYICDAPLPNTKKKIEKEIRRLLVFKDTVTDPQPRILPFLGDVMLGQDFNFTCITYGKGIALTWFKNHKAVSSNRTEWQAANETGATFHRNVLMIKRATKADEGNYNCIVTTSLQPGYSKAAAAKLVVKDAPGEPSAIVPSAIVPSSWKITLLTVSVVLFLVLLLIAAILYRRRQLYGGFYIFATPSLPDMITRLDASIPLIHQVNKLPYDKQWEFPREQLHFDTILGSGAFGEVYLADADGCLVTDSTTKSVRRRLFSKTNSRKGSSLAMKGPVKVAVKTLKEDAGDAEHKDLLSELKILIHIGSHENIVNLLGACTRGRHRDVCVIIEYCPHGSMLQFLRDRRNLYNPTWLPTTEDPEKQFSISDVVSAAFQVARAMEFLASRKCVHRDLAARNVLIGANYVVKVADFGLARDIYNDVNYVQVSQGLVPVKWMAIESLKDRVYSAQSDVWSFGVFLWELFTLGGCPYHLLPISKIYQFLKDGNRMECPVNCPEEMYAMMRDCWMEKPGDRPNFSALVQRLDFVIESEMAVKSDMEHTAVESGEHDPLISDEATDSGGHLKPVEHLPLGSELALSIGNYVDRDYVDFKKETAVSFDKHTQDITVIPADV